MPQGVRVWVFYGSCRGGAPNTPAGVTERGPGGDAGSGDGVVLAESARGLPIHGAGGVPGLLRPDVVRVDLGPVGHSAHGLLARERRRPLRRKEGPPQATNRSGC
jgi:hypothetical protein